MSKIRRIKMFDKMSFILRLTAKNFVMGQLLFADLDNSVAEQGIDSKEK